jgi:hypothetical protein
MKHFSIALTLFVTFFAMNGLHAQMVGISTAQPTEMLDVNGRLRIRHANGQTAGIYFDNTYFDNRSFAGIMNADYMGFWGTGTNWHMVMNMNNGNVGIGTTSPTAKLDVNGTLRIRQTAKAGAIMTGLGTQGNMGWVGPVYFMAMGTPTGANLKINTSWPNYTRAAFATPDVNHGNAWDATNHIFRAPLNGIYHFAAHLELNFSNFGINIQVIRRRGNVNTVLYHSETLMVWDHKYIRVTRPFEIALDTRLEINDVVWLEVTGSECTLTGSRPQYYFSGQLVVLQ